MERREALGLTATFFGAALIGSQAFLTGCSPAQKVQSLKIEDSDVALLDEVGETILPDSDLSPGAKAAHIGDFMKTMVNDCYDETEAKIFKNGIAELNQASKKEYDKEFIQISPQQKFELLSKFDQEARAGQSSGQPHFYRMMKELTIWGYFTSEPGTTKALRYNPVPGRYDGCLPYNNENAWA